MKSKYILPALLYAISGVPAADANVLGESELQQCEGVHEQLLQCTDDVMSLRRASFDWRSIKCLTEMKNELDRPTVVTKEIVDLLERNQSTAMRDQYDVPANLLLDYFSFAEESLSLNLKSVNLDNCLVSRDSRVVTIVQKVFHLVGTASDCVTAVKAKLSALK